MNANKFDNGRIRLLTKDDLTLLLAWRNHSNIRQFMLNQQEISLCEHQLWFKKSSNNISQYLLIYERSDVPEGFIQFTKTTSENVANWGFFAAPNSSKGTGKRICKAALDYGFRTLNLHKICGKVLEFNTLSIHLHLSLGFKNEGTLRQHHHIDSNYHNLICFGLLNFEWEINSMESSDDSFKNH